MFYLFIFSVIVDIQTLMRVVELDRIHGRPWWWGFYRGSQATRWVFGSGNFSLPCKDIPFVDFENVCIFLRGNPTGTRNDNRNVLPFCFCLFLWTSRGTGTGILRASRPLASLVGTERVLRVRNPSSHACRSSHSNFQITGNGLLLTFWDVLSFPSSAKRIPTLAKRKQRKGSEFQYHQHGRLSVFGHAIHTLLLLLVSAQIKHAQQGATG